MDRQDEAGRAYRADADDSNVAIVELESGAIGTVASSVSTRVRRDDLISFQIDGVKGSAVAGLHRCHIQPAQATPRVVFDPGAHSGADYRQGWLALPASASFENGQRAGWEAFLRHVIKGTPLQADLVAGLRDVALAQAVLASSSQRAWVKLEDFVP